MIMEWCEWKLELFCSQIHHFLKANSQDKPESRVGKRKGTKEKRKLGAEEDARPRHSHHGPL